MRGSKRAIKLNAIFSSHKFQIKYFQIKIHGAPEAQAWLRLNAEQLIIVGIEQVEEPIATQHTDTQVSGCSLFYLTFFFFGAVSVYGRDIVTLLT